MPRHYWVSATCDAVVLAGQANTPQSFSKRTINIVSSLENADATAFNELTRFSWQVGQFQLPLLFELRDAIYKSNKISFATIEHLATIGLINFDNVGGYVLEDISKHTAVGYKGQLALLTFRQEQHNTLSIGSTRFTNPGSELARICDTPAVDGFFIM